MIFELKLFRILRYECVRIAARIFRFVKVVAFSSLKGEDKELQFYHVDRGSRA